MSTTLDKEFEKGLKNLGLPIPELLDYRSTTDGGRLLFLNEFGCTVRFTLTERLYDGDKPFILKPLFRRNLGQFTMDVYPGLDIQDITQKASDTRTDQINRDHHFVFSDGRCLNYGRLPGTSEYLILDPDKKYLRNKILSLRNLVASIRDLLGRDDSRTVNVPPRAGSSGDFLADDPQTRKYRHLIDLFEKAWPEKHEESDLSEMRQAWNACRAAKSKGDLRSDWEKQAVGHYGRRYQTKLEQAALAT